MASTTSALLAWACAGLMACGAGDNAQTSHSQAVIRPPDSFFELVPERDRDGRGDFTRNISTWAACRSWRPLRWPTSPCNALMRS